MDEMESERERSALERALSEADPNDLPSLPADMPDLRRLPFEMSRALVGAGYFPELLAPGLSIDRRGDLIVVIDCYGAELCEFPAGRLMTIDMETTRDVLAAWLYGLDEEARRTDEHPVLIDRPDSDYVEATYAGNFRARWHRSLLVKGWPTSED